MSRVIPKSGNRTRNNVKKRKREMKRASGTKDGGRGRGRAKRRKESEALLAAARRGSNVSRPGLPSGCAGTYCIVWRPHRGVGYSATYEFQNEHLVASPPILTVKLALTMQLRAARSLQQTVETRSLLCSFDCPTRSTPTIYLKLRTPGRVRLFVGLRFDEFTVVCRCVDSYLPRFMSSHGQNVVDSRGAVVNNSPHHGNHGQFVFTFTTIFRSYSKWTWIEGVSTVVWTLIHHGASTNQKVRNCWVVVKTEMQWLYLWTNFLAAR